MISRNDGMALGPCRFICALQSVFTKSSRYSFYKTVDIEKGCGILIIVVSTPGQRVLTRKTKDRRNRWN
jgi:hypothetical protein